MEQLTDPDEFIKKVTELYETPYAVSSDLIYFRDGRVFNRISKPMCLGGEPIGRVWSFLDITERKEAEEELISALDKAEESNRLKSSFLTNMSHEIRTPMNGILGFTELLKNPNLSSEDQQSFIDLIQISGARMLNTINNIIDISRIESGIVKIDICDTNINDQIEFISKFFKKEVEIKGVSILHKIGLPPEEAIIKTDKEKVYGILTNLIKNAIKFTYDGSIEFGYEKKGEYLEYYVRDTGVGIPKKLHQIIFERFRQANDSNDRNFEGSGLGLSISKSYVEMLGGKIWVESLEGIGSTFYFTLPYNSVSKNKVITGRIGNEKIKEAQIKNLKILIAEDDETSKILLTKIVGVSGNEILYANKGVDAVMTCHDNPGIDLILMDISLPEMDGYEATRQIRQFNKKVTIIAQTAYGFSSDREKAMEAGCDDYISKPINKTLLLNLIEKYIKKQDIFPD
jgi:signal transduction histidine kinase/CheY-like chemotaxis protein